MKEAPPAATVRTEMAIRVRFPSDARELTRILKLQREHGGALRGHLVYRVYETCVGIFLCDRPAEFAFALEGQGLEVDTETVVVARAADRPETLGFLVQTLEAEGVGVAYSFATTTSDDALILLRTTDNPKAEGLLRAFLFREDRSAAYPEPPAEAEAEAPNAGAAGAAQVGDPATESPP